MTDDTGFGFDEDEETQAPNDNLADVRKWGKGWEKTAKASTKELETVKTEKEELANELRELRLKAAAREKNVSDEQLGLLKQVAPNATADDLDAFLQALGPRQETSEETEQEDRTTSSESSGGSFRPVGGGGGTTEKKLYNDEYINEIFRTKNSERLRRMVAEVAAGRAELDLKWAHYIPDEFNFGE